MAIVIKPLGMQRYKHTQSTPSIEWVIQHNLNKEMVVCDTYVNNQLILAKSIEIIDNNSIKIIWSTARSGYAVVC